MDCSTPGLPVHHQLPELAQTHVHRVGDAIQPSHPLSSPSPPAFNLSQHQGLLQWVSSSHQVAKGLKLQLQHQSFQWIFKSVFEYSSIYSIEYIQYYLNIAIQTCTEMPGWGRLFFWVSKVMLRVLPDEYGKQPVWQSATLNLALGYNCNSDRIVCFWKNNSLQHRTDLS